MRQRKTTSRATAHCERCNKFWSWRGFSFLAIAALGCQSGNSGSDHASLEVTTSNEQGPAHEDEPEESFSPTSSGETLPTTPSGALDTSGGAWRLIDVPAASNLPSIVHTPTGWFAVSRRSFGGKAVTARESVIYRSLDGAHWQQAPFLPGDTGLEFLDVTYGNGRYVLVGTREFTDSIWTSQDGESWTVQPQPVAHQERWGRVSYKQGLFFAFGFRTMGVSENGLDWSVLPSSTIQSQRVTHGNGRYLITGNGPFQVSEDGYTWQTIELDCALPGACIADPSGGVHQSVQTHALFAEGRFYSDQLSSEDGITWQAEPGRAPALYRQGNFIERAGFSLRQWNAGKAPADIAVVRPFAAAVTAEGRALTSVGVLDRNAPLPDAVDTSFEDGLTCETATCLLVDNRLYLVPPPGTPALTDKTPRNADGDPLLGDDCPVSSRIYCDDYEARTRCRCDSEAPLSPESCGDVSHFACEGAFIPRADEWHVADVALGGCNCKGSDPNQPSGFGESCEPDGSPCEAPFECLPRQVANWGGPPAPPQFHCTAACDSAADCPSWEATGLCSGTVQLPCVANSCQRRACDALRD